MLITILNYNRRKLCQVCIANTRSDSITFLNFFSFIFYSLIHLFRACICCAIPSFSLHILSCYELKIIVHKMYTNERNHVWMILFCRITHLYKFTCKAIYMHTIEHINIYTPSNWIYFDAIIEIESVIRIRCNLLFLNFMREKTAAFLFISAIDCFRASFTRNPSKQSSSFQ